MSISCSRRSPECSADADQRIHLLRLRHRQMKESQSLQSRLKKLRSPFRRNLQLDQVRRSSPRYVSSLPVTKSHSAILASCMQYQPYKSVILEALSATGLRSIRYAKEIPLVKYVCMRILNQRAESAS